MSARSAITELTLSDDELAALTKRQRAAAQAKALNAMGFTFKRRPDGSVAVDRQHYNQLMGVKGAVTVRKEWEPDVRR
jgi:hypothetical protein